MLNLLSQCTTVVNTTKNDSKEIAGRSPFANVTAKKQASQNKDRGNRILFICEEPKQLINILNIKLNVYCNDTADLIIAPADCFANDPCDSVRALGVFENVMSMDPAAVTESCKRNNRLMCKKNLCQEKSIISSDLTLNYSDCFMAAPCSFFQKTIYYLLAENGQAPKVHLYESGVCTYFEKADAYLFTDKSCSHYPTNIQLKNNICELLLYRPQLYYGDENLRTVSLPLISSGKTETGDAYMDISVAPELPKEKYIYFYECWTEEHKSSNDIDILEFIARKVGKSNIIVRLHPHCCDKSKLFLAHGFKVMSDNRSPWEAYHFSDSINGKVLITVSSDEAFTSHIMCQTKAKLILLEKMMKLSQKQYTLLPQYKHFVKGLTTFSNKESKMIFCPETRAELRCVLDYIEGEINV